MLLFGNADNYTEILWWQTLLGHFRTTKTTFQMLCNEIGPLVSQDLPSHHANHMTFLMCLEEFIRQMHFHLPLFALTLFRTSQKLPQASIIFFLRIKEYFNISKFGISITHFSSDTSKCTLKQGDGNIANALWK